MFNSHYKKKTCTFSSSWHQHLAHRDGCPTAAAGWTIGCKLLRSLRWYNLNLRSKSRFRLTFIHLGFWFLQTDSKQGLRFDPWFGRAQCLQCPAFKKSSTLKLTAGCVVLQCQAEQSVRTKQEHLVQRRTSCSWRLKTQTDCTNKLQ